MPLFAQSWESLVALVVILLLSGLSNWLRQRKQLPGEPGDAEGPPPPLRPLRRDRGPAESAPAEPPFDLERELRRLFGEEPQPPPPPPPIVVPAPAPPSPPPLAPEAETWEARESESAPVRLPAALAEAEAAYQRASALDELAQAKIEAARARAEAAKALAGRQPAATVARWRTGAPEVEAVRAALQSPRTARQAVLAAIILGPPKALEETPSALWLRG